VVSSCGANRDISEGRNDTTVSLQGNSKGEKGLGSSEVFSQHGYYGHINKDFTESNLPLSRVFDLILSFIFLRPYLFHLKATLLPPILLRSLLLLDDCYMSLLKFACHHSHS